MTHPKKGKSFKKIYNDYYPLIINIIYSKVHNKEDAEDICHELFVDCYKKFKEIEDHNKWLKGSIRFAISNYYRKKKITDKDKTDLTDLEDDITLSFENGMRDIRIILSETIGNLKNYKDEKEKILFDLITRYNLTYKQTAEQLNMTRRQVEYKYGQIIRRMQQQLKEKGIEDIHKLL